MQKLLATFALGVTLVTSLATAMAATPPCCNGSAPCCPHGPCCPQPSAK